MRSNKISFTAIINTKLISFAFSIKVHQDIFFGCEFYFILFQTSFFERHTGILLTKQFFGYFHGFIMIRMVYYITLPLRYIDRTLLKPKVVFGLNLAFFDDDSDSGADYWMFNTRGLAGKRDCSLYQLFELD